MIGRGGFTGSAWLVVKHGMLCGVVIRRKQASFTADGGKHYGTDSRRPRVGHTLSWSTHVHVLAAATFGGSDATESLRTSEVGPDQRQRRAGAVCLPPVEGGEGKTSSGAGAGQRPEDNDGSRHGDRCL